MANTRTVKLVGNRLTIDESTYEIQPAGTDRYAVSNEYGKAMGYFVLVGKAVKPDDFGVLSDHSVLEVAKVYRDAMSGVPVKRPECKQVCQIVTFDSVEGFDMEKVHAYRKWLKQQPGLKSAIFARDAETGKAKSIRIWATAGHMNGAAARTPPEEAAEPASSSVEVSALLEDF